MRIIIKNGVLYEAILTAMYTNELYAAPVGFIKRNNEVWIKAYKGSKLSEVVSSCNVVVLNVTHEPELFVKTALKGERIVQFDASREITVVDGLPLFTRGIYHIVLEKADIVDCGEYIIAKYVIKETRPSNSAEIEPYSRCYSSLIELLIYATKAKGVKDYEKKSQYANKAERFLEIISKTCSEEYIDVAKRLQVLIGRWLRE